MTDVPVHLSAKRKRGRPRKDGNLYREHNLQSPANPDIRKKFIYRDDTSEDMVGKTVNGVIEGSFDAGYLISVRTANSCTPFRGVIFQSEKVIPVTPANDIALKAKMHERREIPMPLYNLQSQFNGISSILPSGPQMPVSPRYVFPEATVPRTGSCPNLRGNITTQETPSLGVNNEPPSAHPFESLGILEQDEFLLGVNMNGISTTGDMVSESSFKSIFNSFLGKGSVMHYGNGVIDTPQSAFGTQQSAMIVNQSGWQREHLTDLHHSEMNNLELNFHQNLPTYQSQHGSQEPPKGSESNFHQVDFVDQIPKNPNLKLPLASVMQENKLLKDSESSDVHVERNYLVPGEYKSPNSPENGTNLAGIFFLDEDATGISKEESLFKLELATSQSTLERRHDKQMAYSTNSFTDMDYVLSDIVPSAESHGHQSQLWEIKFA